MSETPSPPLRPQGGEGEEEGEGGGSATEANAAAGKASPQEEEEEEEEEAGSTFYEAKHVAFIIGLMNKTESFEHVVMEHLKVREEDGSKQSVGWARATGACMDHPPSPPFISLPPSLPSFLRSLDVRRVLGFDGHGPHGSRPGGRNEAE